jgi:NADH-quinone oxidoreductase E subunit
MTAGIAVGDAQSTPFAFAPDVMARAERIIARYPPGKQQSAVIPLLDLVQRQNANWVPRAAMDYVADLLQMPRMKVYEVASFYTMFNLTPIGRHFFQVCTTTPCWLRGSDDVMRALKDTTGCGNRQTSPDGAFTVLEVECLGACVNAPMLQLGDDFYEDLDYERTCALVESLRAGQVLPMGSQTGRAGSEPDGGATTLVQRKIALSTQRPPPASEALLTDPKTVVPPDTVQGNAPDPAETAKQAEGAAGASRHDAEPRKRARPPVKIDPPEGKAGTGDEGKA